MKKLKIYKYFILTLFLAVISAVSCINALAKSQQSDFQWGFTIGYNQVFHLLDFSLPVDSIKLKDNNWITSQNFGKGIGFGYSVGLTFEYLFGESSAYMKITFDNLPTRIVEKGYPETITYDFGAECLFHTLTPSEHILDVNYQMICLDALFKAHILFEGFGIQLGPDISYIINAHIKHTHEISVPQIQGMVFETNEKNKWIGKGYSIGNDKMTKVYRDEDILNALTFRFGFKAGTFFEFEFDNFWLIPGIIYDFGITRVAENEDWYVHTLKLYVDVKI